MAERAGTRSALPAWRWRPRSHRAGQADGQAFLFLAVVSESLRSTDVRFDLW